MESLQIIILALVQAATEFLPVSSSGHLILVPAFLGWTSRGIAFDVSLHVGTLLAVLVYFRADTRRLLAGGWTAVRHRRMTPDGRLAMGLIVATIPAALVGLLASGLIETWLRSPGVVAFQLAVFGLLLWGVDRLARSDRDAGGLRMRHFLALGLAQALALVPGTSRSGITMTMARAMGLPREQAARISFLMALPVIALAGAYEAMLWAVDGGGAAAGELLLGLVVSALMGYACIHAFMRLISRVGFGVFAAYRIGLAALIVLVLL